MEASAKFADASILMRKIGFIVVLLRGLLMGGIFDSLEKSALAELRRATSGFEAVLQSSER